MNELKTSWNVIFKNTQTSVWSPTAPPSSRAGTLQSVPTNVLQQRGAERVKLNDSCTKKKKKGKSDQMSRTEEEKLWRQTLRWKGWWEINGVLNDMLLKLKRAKFCFFVSPPSSGPTDAAWDWNSVRPSPLTLQDQKKGRKTHKTKTN